MNANETTDGRRGDREPDATADPAATTPQPAASGAPTPPAPKTPLAEPEMPATPSAPNAVSATKAQSSATPTPTPTPATHSPATPISSTTTKQVAPAPAAKPAAPKPATPPAVVVEQAPAKLAATPAPATPASAKPAATPAPAKPVPAAVAPAPAPKPIEPEAPVRAAPAAPAKSAAKPAAEPAPPAPAPKPAEPVHVPRDKLAPDGDVHAVLSADHRDPFAFLGMHPAWFDGPMVVRALLPWARGVKVLDAATGDVVGTLERIRDEGFFAGAIQGRTTWFAYRLRAAIEGGEVDLDDPYRFPPILDDADVHLLAEGSHPRSYDKLGAHPTTMLGIPGVAFTVWAPHAGRVAVIGDFNDWDGRRHGMRLRHDCGVWEIFLPGLQAGRLYKFEIKSPGGALLADKSDPVAFQMERAPGTASIVCDLGRYRWEDAAWMEQRAAFLAREQPVSIYELHLGSWRRKPEEGHRCLTYQEHAEELVGYIRYMGFTHVQLMPVGEFASEESVGYQPYAPYAPTSRWGTPDEFRVLIDRCHQAGIGVLADWVPSHFSADRHGLGLFDGTHLYEHPDPRHQRHTGSDSYAFDHGRREVANYLVANALFWLDVYHLDGFRVPQVEAMLYLDYGRSRGEWTPNRFGGHENLDAIEFLRRFNEQVYERYPGIFTVAQENSAWQRVSHPTFVGGLGFGFRWNTGWVRDTLRYLSRNPVHRKYYHDELLRGPEAAFSENYILPISHEEVAIGRASLLRKMPGDTWQRFANLRTFYALIFTHPGKKLMFMGDEFAQEREWNSEISLDWHMLGDPMHLGVQRLVRDLNALYRSTPALYEMDCEAGGFEWIDCNDSDQSIVTFLRKGANDRGSVVVICNFTPVVRQNYRVGVPADGFWQERLNTDAEAYGGGNVGNDGGLEAIAESTHGRPYTLTLKVPPFAAVVLEHTGRRLSA